MSRSEKGSKLDRRKFLSLTAGGLATAVITRPASSTARVAGANSRIRIGVIGCGNRANSLIESMAPFAKEENFEFAAVCDVWKVNLERTIQNIGKLTGSSVEFFPRYDDLLNSPEIDAVMITTPDHAHTPVLIAACRAGKDAFCEKPMSMNIAEAREAVDVVKASGRIVQIGTQRRSDGIYMAAAEFIRSGKLGKISVIDLKWNDAGPLLASLPRLLDRGGRPAGSAPHGPGSLVHGRPLAGKRYGNRRHSGLAGTRALRHNPLLVQVPQGFHGFLRNAFRQQLDAGRVGILRHERNDRQQELDNDR